MVVLVTAAPKRLAAVLRTLVHPTTPVNEREVAAQMLSRLLRADGMDWSAVGITAEANQLTADAATALRMQKRLTDIYLHRAEDAETRVAELRTRLAEVEAQLPRLYELQSARKRIADLERDLKKRPWRQIQDREAMLSRELHAARAEIRALQKAAAPPEPGPAGFQAYNERRATAAAALRARLGPQVEAWVAEGRSLSSIARTLTERGERTSGGVEWTASTIRKVLLA